MNSRFFIGHVGLHVRNLEEEIKFLEILGAELTSRGVTPRGRIAFVSLDGETHHNFALFEDGEHLPSGDSKQEPRGVHHIALRVQTRKEVDFLDCDAGGQGHRARRPACPGARGRRARSRQQQLLGLLYRSQRRLLRDLLRADDGGGVSQAPRDAGKAACLSRAARRAAFAPLFSLVTSDCFRRCGRSR